MAYPTNNAAKALEDIDRLMLDMKDRAGTWRSVLASRSVLSTYILEIAADLIKFNSQLTALKSTPGIVEVARTQKADSGLDVIAEFNSVETAIANVYANIDSTFPKSGGKLLHETLTVTGVTHDSFTTTQTAGLRTVLDSLIATIN